MNILFAGCGDIAMRSAPLLPAGARCVGLRRHVNQLPALFTPYQADLRQPDQLQALVGVPFDYVVVTLTPAGRNYHEAYVEASANLIQVLTAAPPKRVLYISSTSVYHQREHEWVDESSPALAQGNGEQLRLAEQLWLDSPLASSVLRLSGIYGHQRRSFIEQIIAGAVAAAGAHYTNRIHSDDAARAIAHLITRHHTGYELAPMYIVSDDEPADQADIVRWVQQQVPVASVPTPPLLARRAGSKRCNNGALKATGFSFRYPSYREGYGPVLGANG